MTDNGSVHSTSRMSPGASDFNALRVFSAGSGHFRRLRSSLVGHAQHGGPRIVKPLLHQA